MYRTGLRVIAVTALAGVSAVFALAVLSFLTALSGCGVTSTGDSLPGARAYADREYHDPWRGIDRQYHGDDATPLRR